MIQAVRRNANVSLEQFNSIVEDYKTRLLRNGYSLHSYYSAKAQMAFQRYRLDEAKEYLDLRKLEKHDKLSFCVACDLHDLVEYELLSGRVVEAFEVGMDLFAGREYCKYIPFQTVCLCVNQFERHGSRKIADKLFNIAVSGLDSMQFADTSNIGYVGKLIHFLTRKDKNEAFAFFEKYVSWSVNCEDYYNLMFSFGVLSLFKGSGSRELNVSPEIPWYQPSGVYELPVLYDYYNNQATTLAAKFDARNGGTYYTDELSTIS
jgi:hypothetical protein